MTTEPTPAPTIGATLARIPGTTPVEARPDGVWMLAPDLDVQAMAEAMNAAGFRLSTITGLAQPDDETTIIYHFIRLHEAVNVKTRTRNNALPSIAPTVRPASWAEREIHDLFGVTFTGHPNLAPLIRPPQLNEGFFREPSDGTDQPAERPAPAEQPSAV
jgi:NADH-quinone oxidoreductase subunit C